MTLDEAIKHCKDVARDNRAKAEEEWRAFSIYPFGNVEESATFVDRCDECAEQHEQLAKWLEELKEYEDLEEQGLLLKLPFDVNSEVFIVSKQFILERNCMEYEVKKLKVRDFNYNFLHNFTIVCEERIGDSICQRHLFNTDKIFLTKEEAEKELKRLESAE